MQHNGPNTMAQLSRNLRRLGLSLKMDKHGVTVVRKRLWLSKVEKRTVTLLEAHHWVKEQANATV